MRFRVFYQAALLCLLLLIPSFVGAQPEEPQAGTAESPSLKVDSRLDTLGGLLESITVIKTEIESLEKDYRDAETDEQKQAVAEEIEERRQRMESLENDFSVLAAGIDRQAFFEPATQEFDWNAELQAVFSPLLVELKAASAYPREVEALRSELILCERRLPLVEEALSNLKILSEESKESTLNERLEDLTEFWTQQKDVLTTQYESTQQRLQEKEREKVTLGQASAELIRIFFKKRVVNLLFAFGAFLAIFMALRYFHRLVHRLSPTRGTQSRQLIVRLADIAYYLFTVVVAIGALLVALYLSADWVLLTIAVLILIGVAWAARNAIPLFLEQAKLLLNVGAVREGERLIYGGIPWRVVSLSLFSELENPDLRGGTLRLPLKDLAGYRSRQFHQEEPWFPSRMGDWVILSDGTYGEVVEQTPEVVVVSTVRGSHKHYPTVDYLEQHPKNLSCNVFSVNDTVGLDYCYRDIVNTEIIAKVKKVLEDGFRREAYGEHLLMVLVELKKLGESSLDVITIAKFNGAAASEYTEIGWKLQQLALEACNQNGWEIPFPQLAVHRAGGDASATNA